MAPAEASTGPLLHRGADADVWAHLARTSDLCHPAHLCPDTQGCFCPQVKTEISVESKHQTLQGLAFPLQLDAQQAIQALKQKKINYIQLVSPCCISSYPL